MTARRPVDRHRQAAYDAERFAFEGSWLLATVEPAEAVRLTEGVLASPAWRRLHPGPVTVGRTDRAESFCTESGHVAFGRVVELSTIAHELAHAVTNARHPGVPGHGPEWRGWFVTVVDLLHGDEAAAGLVEAFAVYGLDVVRHRVEHTGRPLLAAPPSDRRTTGSSHGPRRPPP